jgi:hypothetical protein
MALAFLLSASSAHALTQPDGAPIPASMGCDGGKPTGLAAALACACKETGVCNIGKACPGGSPSCDPGKNGTCETRLWHAPNDNSCIPSQLDGLDPSKEAAVVPETFHPTCPQTFTLITRGTALFQNAFGWYNATGQKPKLEDLHLMLDCSAKPGASAVLDLSKEPGWKGGDIGFFLVTPEKGDGKGGGTGACGAQGCCASLAGAAQGHGFIYYSERKLNPDYLGTTSFIHLLTLQSQVHKDAFYFAWEDSNKSPNNDFTDMLTRVTGIRCSGAGVACDTGKQGVCRNGVTVCLQGTLSCEPLFESGAEACNGVDDDCDGEVDDAATCDDPKKVCHQGRCVGRCELAEFPCPGGLACDSATGFCVTPKCIGVSCLTGQTCRDGVCGEACAGVVCPSGQTCVADRCLELCSGVSCAAGEVCESGKCFPGCSECDGLSCAKPKGCDTTTGLCADLSCPAPCPAGTHCVAGSCQDLCAGVKCPSGQSCVAGQCCTADECGGGADGGPIFGTGGGNNDGGAGTAGTAAAAPSDDSAGCGCFASGSGGEAALGFLGLGFGLGLGRRRRRHVR